MNSVSGDSSVAVGGEAGWLTLKEAAALCGCKSADLRKLIERGRLRAFTVQHGNKTRFRVLRTALVEARLLTAEGAPVSPAGESASVELLALIRDQNARIARLEDERALLAAQLGAAMERLRSIDERLSEIESVPPPGEHETVNNGHAPAIQPRRMLRTSLLRAAALPATTARRWKRGSR